MQINEIYVELGQTRSQNFQSSQNRVGLRASLDEGDNVTDSVRTLQRQAHALLLKRIGTEQRKENDTATTDTTGTDETADK
jgi:hypothetical protein